MEKRKPVDTYQVNLYCDMCGGLMKPSEPNVALCTYPAQYTYHCTKCDNTVTSYIQYPYLEYREKE